MCYSAAAEQCIYSSSGCTARSVWQLDQFAFEWGAGSQLHIAVLTTDGEGNGAGQQIQPGSERSGRAGGPAVSQAEWNTGSSISSSGSAYKKERERERERERRGHDLLPTKTVSLYFVFLYTTDSREEEEEEEEGKIIFEVPPPPPPQHVGVREKN
jgi:hypothetical protein